MNALPLATTDEDGRVEINEPLARTNRRQKDSPTGASCASIPSNWAGTFFTEVAAGLDATDTTVVVVTHVLPGQMEYLGALNSISTVAALLPKPKSEDARTRHEIDTAYACDPLDRGRFGDPQHFLAYLEQRVPGKRLVLLDIGGYFAPALSEVAARYSGQLVGVVEDTENGQRRYEDLSSLPCPVYTVARSPLKEPEDRLVGEAIVFSVETLLRHLGEVMSGRYGCVLGFGKIGAGIATALHSRHVHVSVLDLDPVRQAQALARGFATADLDRSLGDADVVFSATGSRALGLRHLPLLRDGAYLAGATSRDDEFDFELADLGFGAGGLGFSREDVIPGVARYRRDGRSWHLLGNGNAVNFLHNSAIGPAIHLIKAEVIAAVAELGGAPRPPGIYEVEPELRAKIAEAWVRNFSHLATGNISNLAHLMDADRFTYEPCDITTPFTISAPADFVFHLASPASPADYLRLPLETLRVGALGTMHVLDVAEQHGARLLLASTSEVYGDPLEHPQRERYWGNVNPVGPRSVYDEAKRYAEALVTCCRDTGRVDTTIARIFNTYGPRMRFDDGRAVPSFLHQAVSGQPITVTGDGSQTRSLCYVDDTVDGLLALAASGIPGPVNIGNPHEITMLHLAETLRELTGSASPITFVPLPADDPARRCPDIALARLHLGWEPQVGLLEGLRRTLEASRTPGSATAASPRLALTVRGGAV